MILQKSVLICRFIVEIIEHVEILNSCAALYFYGNCDAFVQDSLKKLKEQNRINLQQEEEEEGGRC